MTAYATIDDFQTLVRTLTQAEQTRAEALISAASSIIRLEGAKHDIDTDYKFENDEDYANLLTLIACTMVSRALSKSTTSEPMTQLTESALGYSVSGTYAMPGRDLYLLNNEKSDLGFTKKQRIGGFEIYELDQDDDS